ncbi:MAG: glycerol-3-phosphate acyltransferase [Acidimicrobiales bacterium]
MRKVARVVAAAAMGTVLGNVPSADLATRAAGGRDLREVGTRNPGGMNAGHTLGRGWGLAVTAADVGKGMLAARVGGRLGGPAGA